MNLKEGTKNYKDKAMSRLVKVLNVQTEEQKIIHWKRVDSRRVGWWGVVSKRILPLYIAEGKELDKLFKGKKPPELDKIATRSIQSHSPEWEKVLTAILAAIIEDFGSEVAEDLDSEPKGSRLQPDGENGIGLIEGKWTYDPMSTIIRAWIAKNGAASVKSILDTNIEEVRAILLSGVEGNLGTPKIARNLRQFYTDRSPFKAMRVARTETSHAAGFGQREAANQSGGVKTHTWITSRDDRVRDDHVVMDNETVKFDKAYSNGAMYPGELSIMCRCVEAFGTRQ